MISREVVDDVDVSIQGRSPGFLGFVFRWLAFVAESVAVRGSGERSGSRARFFCFGTVRFSGQCFCFEAVRSQTPKGAISTGLGGARHE